MAVPESEAAYVAEVESWRQARLERLRAPGGWLTLVDRILLEPGANPLPIGVVTVEPGAAAEVSFRAAPGVDVTLAGAPVRERRLRSDQEAGGPDRLESGGRSYELIRRGSALAVRVKDPQAPGRLGFGGLEFFPVDPAWRVVARFERLRPPRLVRQQLDIGEGAERTVPGLAHFEREGRSFTLEPVVDEDPTRLFFVFGDETNRRDTYPGGRFLYADRPGSDDHQVVLDFNRAFNAPCVFTPFATCPAIPAGNRLALAVTAGERRYPWP